MKMFLAAAVMVQLAITFGQNRCHKKPK